MNLSKNTIDARLISMIMLCCLGFIIYSNTLDSPFHFDDKLSIAQNLKIRDLNQINRIFSFWPTRFITYLSIALNYYLEGFNVFGYHLFNLAVHLVCAILAWCLVRTTFAAPLVNEYKIAKDAGLLAFFAALVFLAHPIQTQAVTYIIQRATALAALFSLAALFFYAKSRLLWQEAGNLRAPRCYYALSLVAVISAMFSKEISISLPALIILYEFYFFKADIKTRLKYIAPFLVTFAIIPLTMLLTKSVNFGELRLVSEPASGISPLQYLFTQLRVMVTYLRLLVLPLNQNLDYDYPLYRSLFGPAVLLSLAFLGVIIFTALKLFSRQRIISFSIFWFFLALLPESSIIPIQDLIFEHRLYLPMFGFSLFLVTTLYYLTGRKNLKAFVAVLILAITGYSFLTYNRNFTWKDELTLWNDVIRKSPRKARPYSEKGNIYVEIKDYERAIEIFSKAIEVDPNYATAYNNRAIAYNKKGEMDLAISDYTKAIALKPKSALSYYNRGNIFKTKGNFNLAIADYTKAVELEPDFALAFSNRGNIYKETGRPAEAMADYNSALRIEPNLDLAYLNRGNVYQEAGNLVEAVRDYSLAIKINPVLASAYRARAAAYFLMRQYDMSWQDVRKLEELGYEMEPGFLETLKKASGRRHF